MYLFEDTTIVRPSGWREDSRRWGAKGASDTPSFRSLTACDLDFPVHLRGIPDPPGRLWMRGSMAVNDALAVAIVGSRRATPRGLALAERVAGDLAARGITIVSGLARGIDSAAHRGALEAGGRTI